MKQITFLQLETEVQCSESLLAQPTDLVELIAGQVVGFVFEELLLRMIKS